MSGVSVISVCNYVTLTMCVTQSVVTVVARARNVHRSSAIAAIGSLVTEYSRDIAPRNEIRLGSTMLFCHVLLSDRDESQ